jgi:hypothetical protein
MAVTKKKSPPAKPPGVSWPFGKTNYILFGVALLVLLVGYLLLWKGSITAAPILLVVGYCVLIPIAIIIRPNTTEAEPPESDRSSG